MEGSWGLIRGIVCPLSVVGFRVHGLVGSDVRVAEKISGRYNDIKQRGDLVDGS